MTPAKAKRYVLVGVGGAAVLTTIGRIRAGDGLSPRPAIGALAAGVVLTVGAEVLPDVAGGIALVMLATAAFVVARSGWEGITAATAPTPIGE